MIEEDQAWTVLGIEPTNDVRAIKRAYAAKLKQCRPEDDAAGFQELHRCYKRAVDMAKLLTCENKQTPDEIAIECRGVDKPFEAPTVAPSGTITLTQAQDLAGRALMEQVIALIDDSQRRDDPKAWQFLFDSPYFLDVEFRRCLSIAVFQSVAKFNLNCWDHDLGSQIIPYAVLTYLDELFDWSASEHAIRGVVEEEACDEIYLALDNCGYAGDPMELVRGAQLQRVELRLQAPLQHGHEDMAYEKYREQMVPNMGRFGAFLIDMLLVGLVTTVLHEWLVSYVGYDYDRGKRGMESPLMWLFLALMSFYCWLLESSGLQATVGKKVLKLKVINRHDRPMGLSDGFFRTLLFCGCLAFFAMDRIGFLVGSAIIYFNIAAAPWYLHDKLSKTYVVCES